MEKHHRSRGKGFSDQLGGDREDPTTTALRAQVLAASYHVRPEMVAMLAGLVFGEVRT
jgi:hypothetical protein